jgi:hypothetical protein
MNNFEQQLLATLMHEYSVCVQVDTSSGDICGNCGGVWITYAIFDRDIQRAQCGDLDRFDGVHYLDFPKYCAFADSLEEAWDRFNNLGIDLSDYEQEKERILTEIIRSRND